MFLDQAEFRAQRRQSIQMADWEGFLDKFLADVELPVLEGAGKISQNLAVEFANQLYEQFSEKRRIQAQQQAELGYIEDLKNSASLLQRERRSKSKK